MNGLSQLLARICAQSQARCNASKRTAFRISIYDTDKKRPRLLAPALAPMAGMQDDTAEHVESGLTNDPAITATSCCGIDKFLRETLQDQRRELLRACQDESRYTSQLGLFFKPACCIGTRGSTNEFTDQP